MDAMGVQSIVADVISVVDEKFRPVWVKRIIKYLDDETQVSPLR